MVLAQKVAEAALQIRDRQFRPAANGARPDVAGKRAEEHLINRLEEPFDSPAAARLAGRRKDQPHLDVGGDLFEVNRGEVAAIIRVENFGDAEDDPMGVRLPPNSLAESECGSGRRRAVEGNEKACNRAAVIVDDDG